MISLQQNWRTRGQNRFCLEVGGEGGDGPSNIYMHMWANVKMIK
jgi:hypothetical protein